ncbi:MAG: hypothetical protein K1W05_07345 [Desulfovibrio sp.]|jgi:hypothetical protein
MTNTKFREDRRAIMSELREHIGEVNKILKRAIDKGTMVSVFTYGDPCYDMACYYNGKDNEARNTMASVELATRLECLVGKKAITA